MNVIEALTALQEGKKIAAKKMALNVDSYVTLDKYNRIVDASGKIASIVIFTMDDEFMIYETEEDKEELLEDKEELLIKGKGVAIAEFCKKHDASKHYGESCTDGGNCEIDYICRKYHAVSIQDWAREDIEAAYEIIREK